MKARHALILFLLGTLAVRLWLVWASEPSVQEAYYYLCGERPEAAYFDGPSGTARMTALASTVLGDNWRLIAPLWSLAASLICLWLATTMIGPQSALLAVVWLNLVPAFNIVSVRIGPDLPLLTLCTLGIACLWKALRMAGWVWWVASAGAFAAATLFSYWSVILATILSLFIITENRRHERPTPWIGLVIVWLGIAVVLIPALIWNSWHDWIPMFPSTLTSLLSPKWLAAGPELLNLLLAISPFVAYGAVRAWISATGQFQQSQMSRLAFIAALPFLALALYSVYHGTSASSFFLLALPVLLPLLAAMWRPSQMLTILTTVVAAGLTWPLVQKELAASDGFEDVAEHIRQLEEGLREDVPGGLFLIAGDDGLASAVSYHLRNDIIPPPGHPRVYVRESQAGQSQFAYWPSYENFVEIEKAPNEYFQEQKAANPFIGRYALYVGREQPGQLPQAISGAFSEVQFVRKMLPGKDPLYIYLCLEYQTLPL